MFLGSCGLCLFMFGQWLRNYPGDATTECSSGGKASGLVLWSTTKPNLNSVRLRNLHLRYRVHTSCSTAVHPPWSNLYVGDQSCSWSNPYRRVALSEANPRIAVLSPHSLWLARVVILPVATDDDDDDGDGDDDAGRKREEARARAQREELEAARVRNLPSNQLWLRRGWLVMMRARHQGLLARRPRGWLSRLPRPSRRPGKLTRAIVVHDSTRVSDVELVEIGTDSDTSARTVVMAAVEIHEEGVFRQIVGYL